MEEVDVDAVDLGHELRKNVEPGLLGAPVVTLPPISEEFRKPAYVDAIMPIGIVNGCRRQARGINGGGDPVKLLLRDVDLERACMVHLLLSS